MKLVPFLPASNAGALVARERAGTQFPSLHGQGCESPPVVRRLAFGPVGFFFSKG